MTNYHVETQEDYNALMVELEEKGCKWRGEERKKLTDFDKFKTYGKDTYIYEKYGIISFSDGYYFKAHHINKTFIEYKAKGENMAEEMKQKEMKHNIFYWARDVSVAVESFARDMSESEADLQEAKSSAKKLIEKIDEYLENLKPKFKVGDYVTVYVNSKRKTAKIEKIDELVENNSKVHGLWYDRTLVNFKQDYWFSSGLNDFRHARPTEIAEYEVALTFHKHGRKPFEVKEGDIISYNESDKFIVDYEDIEPEFETFDKEKFIRGDLTFLKTAEEVNEWLENK